MPQLVKKRRSGWAVLATGALIASLLAVAAAPAGAGNGNGDLAPGEKPWNTGPVWPWTSACVGDALDDHMFTDVSERHAFQEAINCIAYYGITNGTGDGSTYSPNDDVTRAEMAVFIGRAATAAGVDLGSGGGGFTDIDNVWSEAQDMINQLAAKGMIPAGGAFRPDDAITRSEMGTFLFGLLLEASPLVSLADKADLNRTCAAVSETCEIRLGEGASAVPVNDWFPDARDSEPLEVDKHISAMWELGVTGGAEALPPGPERPHVLVNITTRAFIDHDGDDHDGDGLQDADTSQTATPLQPSPQATEVSPVPLSFDDDGQATFSVYGLPDGAPIFKTDKYDIDVAVQHFPPSRLRGPYPLAYNYDPQGKVNRGQMAAFITRALAHTTVRPAGVTAQYEPHDDNVVVSVRDGDFQPVSNAVVDVFYTDTPGADLAFRGNGSCDEVTELQGTYACVIDKTDNITGGTGDSSLELVSPKLDTVNGTTVWVWTGDDEDEVEDGTETYRLDIPGGIFEPAALISVSNDHGGTKAHLGSSVLFTLQLLDKYGRATTKEHTAGLDFAKELRFVDSSRRDLNLKGEESMRNDYSEFHVVSGHGVAAAGSGVFSGVFSTEDSLKNGASDVSVRVGRAPAYVAADTRGAATRVKVRVVDQYGDPLPNREVRLRTARQTPAAQLVDHDEDADTPTRIPIANDAHLAVDRSGAYTFGYERTGTGDRESDPLSADVAPWDHDGDEDTGDLEPAAGSGTMQWASEAAGQGGASADPAETPKQILRVDTDTNTIFVGTVSVDSDGLPNGTPALVTANSVEVIYYDSNDRFNIVGRAALDTTVDNPAGSGSEAAGYAEFERNLFNLNGFTLSWDITGRGSRAVNGYTLHIPHDSDINPVIYW